MNQKVKSSIGIYLDNEKAILITNQSDDKDHGFSIVSTIKAPEKHNSEEHNKNHAKQNELKSFFKSIANQVSDFENIYIFGSGISQEQFKNHLAEDSHFKGKKIEIGTANNLTEGQIIAKVNEYFS